MSAKIVVTEYMSLDGVIEDPVGMENSGLGDWTGPFSRGAEGDRYKHQELFSASSLIFGRTTYEGFAEAWPHIKDETGYADRMNQLPKCVASRSLTKATWGPSTIWQGDIAAAARDFKHRNDGEALIFGSASLVHHLAGAGLIDEYRLMIYPALLGRGKRLFPDRTAARLSLIEMRQFGDGVVLLRYAASMPAA